MNDDCMVPVNLLMVNHLKYLPLLLEKWGGGGSVDGEVGVGEGTNPLFFSF